MDDVAAVVEAEQPVIDGMWVLPLHSGVTSAEQQRVFYSPPNGMSLAIDFSVKPGKCL